MDIEISGPPEIIVAFRDAKPTPTGLRGYCPACDPERRHRDGGTLWAGLFKGRPYWCCHRCHCEKDYQAAKRTARLRAEVEAVDDAERSRQAIRILEEKTHLCRVGDVVWAYLTITRGKRFHGPPPVDLRRARLRHPENKREYDVMVGVVRTSAATLAAIHRTYLVEVGGRVLKASDAEVPRHLRVRNAKLSLGPIMGHAIHLGEESDEIGVCEGIESALGLAQATGLVCWSAISAGGLAGLQVPKSVRRIVIGPDIGDKRSAGMKAALALKNRLHAERSIRVDLMVPPLRCRDWGEILPACG